MSINQATRISTAASPAVSVLLPVRNAARYISDALGSVVAQTLVDWELVVVLDASTDASEAIVAAFHDPRIRTLTLSAGVGMAAALNVGLSHCRADLVARMDADDICMANRLERQHAVFAARADLGVLGSSAYLIDSRGRKCGERQVVDGAKRVASRLLWRNAVIHPSAMFRKSVVEWAGGYDPRCHRAEDYHLWLRCLLKAEIDNLPEPLINYRLHPGQHSRGSLLADLRPIGEARRSAARAKGVSRSGAALRQAIWAGAQWRRERWGG